MTTVGDHGDGRHRLGDVVELGRYPIHELAGAAGQALVARCRAHLASFGVAQLDSFLTADAVKKSLTVAELRRASAWASDSVHNVWFEPVPEEPAEGDPLALVQHSAKRAVAYDELPVDVPIRRLYESDEMTAFVSAVLQVDPLYRSADPLDALELAVFEPGGELGWHFDNSEFSVTVMLQPAESGGEFDYVPATRTDGDPATERIVGIITGDEADVVRLPTSPGTLALFHGHHALHRVTPVEGGRPRINAVLTYGDRPGMVLSPLTQQLFYGRNVTR